jgi:hypothetical protein
MEAVELRRAAVAAQVESRRRSAEAIGRDLTEFEISVTPVEQLTTQIVTDYAALGVHRVVVAPPRGPFWRTGWSYADYENVITATPPPRSEPPKYPLSATMTAEIGQGVSAFGV